MLLHFFLILNAIILNPDGLEKKIADKSLEVIGSSMGHEDTALGTVVASPSKKDPDYYYHWTRDAALVMSLFLRLQEYKPAEEMEKHIWNYVSLEKFHQRFRTESGKIAKSRMEKQALTLRSRSDKESRALAAKLEEKLNQNDIEWDLGDPKFHVDLYPYDGGWGRPQNDGPALRALTLLRFAHYLLKNNREKEARTLYDGKFPSRSPIKVDLEYISKSWELPCFDLWEETDGYHFYTRMVQHRALLEGAKLARRFDDAGAADWYETQAKALRVEIEKHWDAEGQKIVPTFENSNQPAKRSDIDSAVVLAVLHSRPIDDTEEFFSPADPRVLAAANAVENSFQNLYEINFEKPAEIGTAIGRYPEDRYDGVGTDTQGHAWFITTAAFAELKFLAAAEIEKRGQAEDIEKIQQLRTHAQNYLNTIEKYVDPKALDLTEQFDRKTGKTRGASRLTWSAAAYLSAMMAKHLK